MAVRIVMPKLGDFMTEGIVTFVKSKGDSVNQGEVLLEIESEKLNYELEAAANGIFHTLVSDGATVLVDDLIGYLWILHTCLFRLNNHIIISNKPWIGRIC